MRYSSLLALCAFMLCLNAPEVRGEILAVHTYDVMTHTALLPKPVASDNTFSLAATWWLPDWQGSQGSRGSEDIGGGDIVKDNSDCMEHYNLYATCPSPKLSTGVVHPIAGMTCQKGCICPSEYIYSSSNCAGEYQVSGTACDGNYNGCTIRPECTVSSKDCTYGCAGYNSCDRCTSCKSNPDCDVSDKSCTYGCASYNSCSKCTSCKDNPDCSATAVSCDYGCASTNSCGICTSCSGNPDCNVSDKSCDYGCAATNSCGKCTSCKSCTPSANETGCTDGTESCSDGCGGTRLCCKGHTHSYSCPSGYQSSSCSSSQVQTGTTSKVCSCGAASGTCYKCKAKTCTNTCFYTLRSCPANGYCKSCQIIGSDCSVASGGTRYSLVSCHNGTYMSGNSCVSSCGITRCQDLCVRSGKRLDECQRTCNLNPCSYS